MSAEYELTRDKDGFLKCKDCSRCFFKEIMFENHLTKEHKKERETQINQNQQSQTMKVEIFFPNNTQSEEDFFLDNLSFVSQRDLKMQSIEDQKTSNHKCSECKKLYVSEINLKEYLSSPQKCKECEKAFSKKIIFQTHVNVAHKGQKHYKCLTCNCSYANRFSLKTHIDSVHKWENFKIESTK